jgi:hypothetical protein
MNDPYSDLRSHTAQQREAQGAKYSTLETYHLEQGRVQDTGWLAGLWTRVKALLLNLMRRG